MLTDERRHILNTMADGSVYNLLGWPVTDSAASIADQMRVTIASAKLLVEGKIAEDETVEKSDEAIWARITDKGRKALEDK